MEENTLNSSLFNNLLENLPGMLCRYTYQSNRLITYVNKGCFPLTGFTPDEFLNASTTFRDLMHPEDRNILEKFVNEVVSTKKECICKYRILTKSAFTKKVKEIAKGVYSDAGDLQYIESYITDEAGSSQNQKISEASNIFSGSDDFSIVRSANYDTILRFSKKDEKLFYKNENVELAHLEENLSNHFSRETEKEIFSVVNEVLALGNSISFQYRQTKATGQHLFEANALKINTNEAVVIIRDITENYKAIKTKDFYSSIINNVNIDIAVLDEQNRYILISKSAIKDNDLRNWMIGKNDFEYCADRKKNIEIAESRTEMYNLVDELKKPIEWIEELSDSGKRRYFVRTLKPLKGPNNEKYKVGFGVDITALKVVQNELLRREHLLSFSHKLAKVGYWVWYPLNRRREWSDGVFDIIEEDKREVSPSLTSYKDYIHPDDRGNYEQAIALSKENSTSYSLEYRLVTKKGKLKYIKEQSSRKRSDSNSNEYLFGMVQDITEMKTSQDALAKSEEHFRAIAESSPVHIVELSADYHITYVNNTEGGGRVLGQLVYEMVIPEYHQLLKETLDKVSELGTVDNIQIEGISRGDVVRWYDLSIGPIKNKEGSVISLILLAQNITDKKTNEQDRERLIKEINDKYNELMQFNYIVSHNLRSPIANILGMSYILNPSTPPEDVKQIFEYIMQSAESIDTLIKDLNEILTARSPLNEKRETFLLTDIINGVCNNLEQQIKMSGAFICLDITSEANQLSSIRSYVQSIVYNLISNAIKYKSPDRNPQITIKAWREKAHTHIEIADNGMGIDLEQYGQQMFGLYKRFTTHNEGKGLGLHMTKAQVESLGGTIGIESELDKGCTFKIVF